MYHNTNEDSDCSTLHFVSDDTRERAYFARMAAGLGIHCELFENLDEFYHHAPVRGIIMIKDSYIIGGVAAVVEQLEMSGVWLPVIAFGEDPTPGKIVEAIKVGALDYLEAPIQEDRLKRTLARTASEAKRTLQARRRKVQAQVLIARLSNRESEVLDLLTTGSSNKLIARELGISPRTVEIHRSNMMNKLNATHAAGAVRIRIEAE